MNLLFKLLLTGNATSWGIIVYLIKEGVTIPGIPLWGCGLLYLMIPVFLSLFSLFLFGFSENDSLSESQEFSLADNEFLSVYLGYFFISLSINDCTTMIFVFAIIFVFTFLSQAQYFNPIFLLFGYHYYHVLTNKGTKVFIICRGKVIRNKEQICFQNLKRLNNMTYIERRKK